MADVAVLESGSCLPLDRSSTQRAKNSTSRASSLAYVWRAASRRTWEAGRMPRQAAPAIDVAPLVLVAWQQLADAVAAEPDDALRLTQQARLFQQWLDTAPMLSAAVTESAPFTLAGLLRSSPLASQLLVDSERQTQVDAAQVAAKAAVEQPFAESGPQALRRQVVLEERLLRAVALGRRLSDPLVPARSVLRLCCRLLARTLAERAPGRSVELRVPPHVAVQCVEGPRHTRGTPPNVVEADPLAFLDVAIGRRDWFETVRSGGIRASGERADLRAWLPLLTERSDALGGS